jgi:hypothetical protein
LARQQAWLLAACRGRRRFALLGCRRYGPADGLPAVYSGHNGHWYWGLPPAATATAVAVGFDRGTLAAFCGAVRFAARLDSHLDVNDDEQDAPVWVCSDLPAPWAAVWPTLRQFG